MLRGGSMAARWWQHENKGKISIYESDDNAELMEKNFGNEGGDDDTF